MPHTEDLAGRRFGRLTVLERTEEKQDRYWLWRCRCDCGGEILVNTKRLTRGTVTSCGCVRKGTAKNGSAAEDLAGRRFGRLTVLERAENKYGRVAWRCRCDCGNARIVTAHDLKCGHVKSCGCQQCLNTKRISDITGQRFGRLTALYPIEKRDKRGSVFWHCRCDCGNEVDVMEAGLVHGNYRSCGCRREEVRKDIHSKLHLIDGTCVEWLSSRKNRRDNTSGFRGVYESKNGHYRALIGFKKQKYYIGTYETFEEAVQGRLEAEELIHEGFVKAYQAWQEKAGADEAWAREHPLVFEIEKRDGSFHVITK